MKKNIKTIKKQATQEFFPRSKTQQKSESVNKEKSQVRSQIDGKTQFIFNKAPINKNEAFKESKNTLLEKQDQEERKKASGVQKSNFLKKLYEDEDELNELKVLGVLDDDDEDIKDIQNKKAEEGAFLAKRKAKAIDKMGSVKKSASIKQDQENSRVGRLSLKKGSNSLFAICEIADDHLIVNHSRNTKGYVSLKGTNYENNAQKLFKVGQYIVAYVVSEIGQIQISQSSADPLAQKQKSKKVQLSIDLSLINKQLSIKSVSTNMVLQGQILSKEEKGYTIDFGFKDQTKGFLKFTNEKSKNYKVGLLVHVVVKSVIESSKVIKCEILSPLSHSDVQDCVQQKGNDSQSSDQQPSSINQIKPGFLVSGKVCKIYENGIELTFMGGIQGTIFQDHLQNQNDSSSLKNDPSDFKIGQKVIARVLSVDQISKKITLSLKNNIIQWQSFSQMEHMKSLKIGQLFENVKILQEVYGGSFLIQLNDKIASFLHKTHFKIPQNQEDIEMKIENDIIKEKQQKQEEIKIGDQLKSVKIKEINWFDCMPIVSIREEIIKTSQLNYIDIQVGQFLNAKIKKVDQIGRYISLSLNGFVKGKLYIEQMSENPIKMIPPKLQELEKEIKVRVLNVDSQKRLLEFTKKDSLMREDCPVFKSYKDIKVGDEYVGVVVSSNQYGYITNSFGNLKGLLTFADIEQKKLEDKKFQESSFKVGTVLRAYCLFKKADQGVALTLSKNNAQKNSKDQSLIKSQDVIEFSSSINEYFPTESEINDIQNNEQYQQALEYVDKVKIGQIQQFRIIENSEDKKYVILKSTNCEKKKKNFLGILPKCLIESNISKKNQKLDEDQSYQGLVLQFIGESIKIPVLSVQKQLVELKDEIFSKEADTKMSQGESYIGIVNGISGKANHVSVRFLNGINRSIKVKDLNVIQNYQKIYYVGKIVRVGINKLERLCIKEKVIYACSSKSKGESDKIIQIKSFAASFGNKENSIKIGEIQEAKIQLIKDYGIITQISQNNVQFTGFITNQQKLNEKRQYKQGEDLKCLVLDVDFEKNIVDLSEILAVQKMIKNQEKEIKEGQIYKALVELNKETYLVLSIKNQRQKIGICLLQNFNNDDAINPYQSVQVGDEIEVKVVGVNECGFLELIKIQKSIENKKVSQKEIDLSEGSKLSCKIKSIKNNQIFLHLNSRNNQIVLGRLHLIECESLTDFNQFQQGDEIDVKVLKASADLLDSNIQIKNNASWVELTRLPIHMKKSDGLDKSQQQKSLITLKDLKVNQIINDAIIIDALNFKNSNPLMIQISPFLRGQIPFNQIVSLKDLLQHGSSYFYSQKFIVGQKVKATYIGSQQFSLLEKQQVQQFKKGELVIVRFVKVVYGRGVTVQMDENNYGFIETCEITDEIIGNVFKLCENKSIFAARIIDQDTKGKWQLSSRESIIDEINWKRAVGPDGSSKQFQDLDVNIQNQGNQRNKILKYGANVALNRNDLCIGYIINIAKAGCFIQIGHNCVVRAGLNELSDQINFDFQNEMPIGRLVVGRISKIEELSSGKKHFHFSTRQSLVVYGVGSVERNKLQLDQEVTSIVMAIAEGKAFCQIKGSYIKIKVKTQEKFPKNFKIGDHVISKITKITKEKISSLFISKAEDSKVNQNSTSIEQISENLYKSINSEAQKNDVLIELKQIENKCLKLKENDFDVEKVDKIISPEEEIAKQIEDLRNLERQEETLDIEDEEMSQAEEDSDEEEIKRLVQLDQESDEDINQDLDDYDDEEGENDQSDEEIKIQSDSSEDLKKESLLKKRTLKERIREEQQIREQEKRMRSDTEKPKDIDDYERLLISNKDQAYLWIQYMAFMLENVGIDAARKVVERAVKEIPMTNEQEKINIWTAYMNLENNFGSQEQLEKITKRALEVNDRKKIYLNLVDIYKVSMKFEFIEAIYKQLCKKFGNNLEIWSAYLEFLIEMKQRKDQGKEFIVKDFEFTEPKAGLQKGLQALSKDQHVNLISKYGILEFKYEYPENGRTIFEGIISNYPKRMDIWSIYMDMEIKYGQNNLTQARHLFERCLSNEFTQKKPKKMKLVFQKYMEFENKHGNKQNIQKIRERVEQYLSQAYPDKEESAEDS